MRGDKRNGGGCSRRVKIPLSFLGFPRGFWFLERPKYVVVGNTGLGNHAGKDRAAEFIVAGKQRVPAHAEIVGVVTQDPVVLLLVDQAFLIREFIFRLTPSTSICSTRRGEQQSRKHERIENGKGLDHSVRS